ncbi:MAG: hypothetical protein R2838_03450 [Caldilineaceae bacterium]
MISDAKTARMPMGISCGTLMALDRYQQRCRQDQHDGARKHKTDAVGQIRPKFALEDERHQRHVEEGQDRPDDETGCEYGGKLAHT